MKAVGIKFRESKFRSFYRIYILPYHIGKRTGAVKKAMEEELAGHKAFVKDNGLKAELKVFTDARDLRQSTYDAMVAARTEVKQNPSEKAGLLAEKTLDKFKIAKLAYKSKYQ